MIIKSNNEHHVRSVSGVPVAILLLYIKFCAKVLAQVLNSALLTHFLIKLYLR